jgi:proteasome alpha subunit
MSDGRRLIEQAQYTAQEHKVKYDANIDVLNLVKSIANIQQYYSQAGGLRPFGVSLLIGGIENSKPVLYMTTPSGIYMRFLARSVGQLSDKINEKLEEEYKENMSTKDAIKLGLKIFKDALEKEFAMDRFDVVTLDLKENATRYEIEELKKII